MKDEEAALYHECYQEFILKIIGAPSLMNRHSQFKNKKSTTKFDLLKRRDHFNVVRKTTKCGIIGHARQSGGSSP
ncbi:hypothetical protein OUZ56_020728 [Daphnia magna]|uniref:Uncharacterized protein n=1 Tax=Daphnia magna TaxID=35525 RepID=A0ABQ9ZFA6_9CRUS|nr:hypothetical protein OUZ56_020728 [Daphnia magna]